MSSGAALDTIVAPATPVGRSALAIVRIDGPESAAILTALMRAGAPEARVATFTSLYAGDERVDECIAIRYAAPHSFTGNDLVELTLHGNPLLVERVLEAARALGARSAEPGEFTERAVLNGKLDLVQAESIADLINARTSLQAKLSLSNLDGTLSRTASSIRESLLNVISRLEAALDFSDEGYEFITRDEARSRMQEAIAACASLAETYRRGRATTRGLSLVILGAPNAGKSTLLNRLVGSERAIVTPIPGTTRDIVRETIEIGGLPVTIADTAGLRENADVVEEIGIERARRAAEDADVVLYLIDATRGPDAGDQAEIARFNALPVFTKRDLAPHPPSAPSPRFAGRRALEHGSRESYEAGEKVAKADEGGAIFISALTGEGIPQLLARLDTIVRERFAAPERSPTVVNERQRAAIAECEASLQAALESLHAQYDEQVVLVDLYAASAALAALTGSITQGDVFTAIFSSFCIGK
ncbi:MAG TPA: tRNA uridine-5-carboxymethylaminomethyl(34) synthesis GTPase MnmE [Thermoanaerobaculia bacterium]|nr:tRNA uridine-5-carboxymethylaminomethyl(34) synthesis GTPase MnmE [Thermoanaerobaculia bacterium]